MTYGPHRRDGSWQMIQPGCYIDPAGCAHLFPDEVLAELHRQFPEAGFDACDPNDWDMVTALFAEQLRVKNPDLEVRLVKHEREVS
jgi:hypothetical protein